jgi:NAD(P)-dependent dehydrogenase (short-subunit alcohol dehydrogenase family)
MPANPKNILITGGSRGIGAAVAIALAGPHTVLAINYTRNADAANKVLEQVQQLGGQGFVVQADVADPAQVKVMFLQADQQFAQLNPHAARLHGLVNNAGIVDQKARLIDMSDERLAAMFNTNVLGAFVVAREACQRMMTSQGGQGGAIVNVSSAAARLGSPGEYVDYAASKGAVDTMTIGLAKELALEGVRVNAVRPGLIDTEIHASGGQPDRIARFAPLIPMQRGGLASEVAEAIVWLLSDQASYCTGALLDVSGGR